ncbi:MAG: DNA-binding response regulator [Rhodospirillaceae bacterium]|nr:MAG: DNA-binding response regulator [Rhodospirillaceae bacterium]
MINDAVIHIVDDDEPLRRSLGELFKTEGFQVQLYESAEAFLEKELPLKPGCIILDLRLPDMSGMEIQAAIVERNIHLPILFLTGHGKIHTAVEAIKRGAMDFLEKPIDNDILVATVRDAVKRSAALTWKADALSKLTLRERELISFIERNTPNKEIAHQLDVSIKTVEFHKRNISEKIDLKMFRQT